MLWIDQKYVQMLGVRLRNFKRKSQFAWNFSCPYCGDSKLRPRAARGYVYKKGEKLNYKCHKCGIGRSVKNLIKDIDPGLYREMQLDYFKPPEKTADPVFPRNHPVFDKATNPFHGLIKISALPKDHFCRKYVAERLIPSHHWDELYFAKAFYTWSGHVLPGRYKVPKDIRDDEPRLVIPMRNQKGEVTGFQGRALRGAEPKYVFVALTKDEPLIWGLNLINPHHLIYVMEGPIDAMFIPNAIAGGGSDLASTISRIGIPIENFVIIYDNEPRSPFTIAKIQRAIQAGFAVCIWPLMQEKDVNEMVKKNINFGLPSACQYVFTRINEGIYRGASAVMALTRWKKTETEKKKPMEKNRSNS